MCVSNGRVRLSVLEDIHVRVGTSFSEIVCILDLLFGLNPKYPRSLLFTECRKIKCRMCSYLEMQLLSPVFLLPKNLSVFLVSLSYFKTKREKDISSGFLHCLLNDSAVHPVVPQSLKFISRANRVGSNCMWLRRCGIHFPIRCLQWEEHWRMTFQKEGAACHRYSLPLQTILQSSAPWEKPG